MLHRQDGAAPFLSSISFDLDCPNLDHSTLQCKKPRGFRTQGFMIFPGERRPGTGRMHSVVDLVLTQALLANPVVPLHDRSRILIRDNFSHALSQISDYQRDGGGVPPRI